MHKLTTIIVLTLLPVGGIVVWKFYRGAIWDNLHKTREHASSETIAVVDDVPITVTDLQFELDLQLRDAEISEAPDLRQEVLAELLERKIFYAHILKDERFQIDNKKCTENAELLIMGDPSFYTDFPQRQQRITQRMCEREAIHRYRQELVYANITLTDEELAAYFSENRATFPTTETVSFRQIVLPNETQARRIRNKVNTRNFKDYARKHSIAPEAWNGGLVGPFTKNELPQVFHTLFKMKKRQITDVLKSPYGFHIIMLVKKHTLDSLQWQDFRAQIEAAVYHRKKTAAYQQWLKTALHEVKLAMTDQ